jgi:hypothetical protein
VVLDRTVEARAAIFRTLQAHAGGRNIYVDGLRSALLPMARTIARWITDNAPVGFSERLCGTLYRDGPILLDQPAELYKSPQ